MKQALGIALVLVAATSIAAAQTVTWKVDKAHSQVTFSVSHLVVAEVTGRFTDFDVTFQQADDDFTKSQIETTIKAASINTDIESRDKHLRSDDFLNAEKFPAIIFKSSSIEKTGTDTYTIKGDLTIRGVTKSVVLDTKYKGSIEDPWGNTKVGFRAVTTINRFDYGVKWNKATEAGGLVAGKDVEIILLMEFQKAK